jgi:HEPN domain-containing protein
MTEKLEIIRLWIEKGDHDLGTAEIVNQHIPEYMDTIAFHCQQAVEKYLKAFLIFHK